MSSIPPSTSESPAVSRFIPILMTTAVALGSMSITIFTPALPTIESDFQCGTDKTQQLLSLNFGSIAISGIIYGALSESFGRRPLFLFGYLLFSAAAYLSFLAPSIDVLMTLQMLQGIGAGVGTTLSLAVIRDVYHGKKATKILSAIGIVMPLSPAFSPFIGGYLTDYFGWRSIFFVLGTAGFLLFLSLIGKFPETLQPSERKPFSLLNNLKGYGRTLKNSLFSRLMLLPCLGFAGLWAYSSAAPFFFIDTLGLSASAYGLYPIISVLGIVIGNGFVNRLVHIWPLTRFIQSGALLCLCSTLSLLYIVILNVLSPLCYALTMTVYCIGFGAIFSSSLTLAMEYTSHGKGFGAALIRAGQILSASIAVSTMGIIFKSTLFEPTLFILVCILILNGIVWSLPKEISN